LHKPVPTAPYKFLPGESYKRSPTIKFQINEDGTVSNIKLIRSSGVKDIDRKLLKEASGWKFRAVPGCVIDSKATIDIDRE
jgi:TonB family protein